MKVSDADLIAAKSYCAQTGYHPEHELLAQAFARHRHEAIEMAAKVADHYAKAGWSMGRAGGPVAGRHLDAKAIATDIRALAGEDEISTSSMNQTYKHGMYIKQKPV